MVEITKEKIKEWSFFGMKGMVGCIAEQLANADSKFMLIYSDVAKRISIQNLLKDHSEKCIEVGIAEQNQVVIASAMANEGFHVYATAYAPFITARVLDQIRVNLGYMKSPVVLIGLGAGLGAGDLGATHTALEDIANMRGIPNITVVAPADCLEFWKLMQEVNKMEAPVYIRLTDLELGQNIYCEDYKFEIGKAVSLKKGKDAAIISCGTVLLEVVQAAKLLEEMGLDCEVINMHTIKPLDEEVLQRLVAYKNIITVEEHSIIGGLGSSVAEYYSEQGANIRLKRVGIQDIYFSADRKVELMNKAGLTANRLKDTIFEFCKGGIIDEG